MATVVTASITDKVATLVLDDASGLVVGQQVLVVNVGQHFDGTQTLSTVDLDTDTVTYKAGGQDVEAFAPVNGFLFEQVTWVDADDLSIFLGIAAATANDTAFLEICAGAANTFAFRRRFEAGYCDCPTAVPNDAVKLGAMIYGSIQYRSRGSIDSFQSFENLGINTPFGSLGQVLQLLGVGRAGVA